MNKYNVALLGCGYIAREVHIPVLAKLKNIKITSVCDINESKALEISRKFGIRKVYTQLQDMLKNEKIDIIDICTPPESHAMLIKEVLKEGFPCIVEKPLAIRVEEADEIIELSKKKGVKVYVMHNYSFLPVVRKAKQMVNIGKIGEIIEVETRYFTPLKGERYYHSEHWVHALPAGVLTSELLPHLLMLVIDFIDHKIVKENIFIAKRCDLPYIKADELRISLITSNNVFGYIGLSYNSPTLYHTLDIFGEKGIISIDFFTHTLTCRKASPTSSNIEYSKKVHLRGLWALTEIFQKIYSLTEVGIKTIIGSYNVLSEGHKFLFQECFKDLEGKSKYPIDINKCREVVRLMESVYKSIKT